jgi:hypothetical protein
LPSAVSVVVVELALGVDAFDAIVDVGLLILVDPLGRDPFGESVGVDAAAPAFLQEVGVVIPTEQGEIGDGRVVAPNRVTT